MDRVSNLPKHILHEILSRMPEKDAVRTSILSKTWKETYSTFPILIFVEPLKDGIKKTIRQMLLERCNFLNHVSSTLQRFHDQGLAIKTLKLHFPMGFSDPTLSPRIDHWMQLASDTGIEVLHLILPKPIPSLGERYCLRTNILESKSLVEILLEGCLRVDKAFMNQTIKFCSLQVLTLSYVYVGEELIFQSLISSCPLIEHLTLDHCKGLKSVKIRGLPKLMVFQFSGIQKVVVDAPSLEYFRYSTDDSNNTNPCLDECRNLRDIFLSFPSFAIIANERLVELFHKFPLLERLELERCTILEKIQFSSKHLQVLKFTRCFQVEEACIDAPKLYYCGYYGSDFTVPTNVSFPNCSSTLEFNVRFDIFLTMHFVKLRNFLLNIKPTNVLASLVLDFNCLRGKFDPDLLLGLSIPPPCIKHLHLQYSSEQGTFGFPDLIGLFWSCRPAIISIKLNSTLSGRRVVALLCEMLMGIFKEDDCYCNTGVTKCWWHGLKGVKVTISSAKYENVVIGRKTLLEALPTLSAEEEISFRLDS